MKKTYIEPSVVMAYIGTATMICQSAGSGVSSDNGITYGGVDQNGDREPSSRHINNVWEDEEENDESF